MKINTKKHIPDKIFKGILANMPVCTIDVVLLNKKKDKTLLFKRNNEPLKNVYFTIGGRALKGEILLDCAVRQAKRELNLKINPKKTIFVGVTQENHKNSIYKNVSYDSITIIFVYILEKEDVDIKFDAQHSAYKWFPVRDKSIHPHIKERIRQTLLALKNK